MIWEENDLVVVVLWTWIGRACSHARRSHLNFVLPSTQTCEPLVVIIFSIIRLLAKVWRACHDDDDDELTRSRSLPSNQRRSERVYLERNEMHRFGVGATAASSIRRAALDQYVWKTDGNHLDGCRAQVKRWFAPSLTKRASEWARK